MLRILKYLKPYWLWIVLSVGLLFLQANLDLALPDYMSRIVNTGIQQGGVENTLPQALSKSGMERLGLIMSPPDSRAFMDSYDEVSAGSTADTDPAHAQALRDYPGLAEKGGYVLKSGAKPAISEKNLDQALLALQAVAQVMDQPGQPVQASPAASAAPAVSGTTSQDAAGQPALAAPAGTAADDAAGQLARLEALKALKAKFQARLDAMDPGMLKQAALKVVRAEYEALGADMGSVQTWYILKVGLEMLLITLGSALAVIIVGWLAARTAAGTARDLRKAVFTRVENFSLAEFDTFSTASLITRSTNDVTQVQHVIFMFMRMVIYAPIMGIGGVILALAKAPSMAWIIGLAVLVLLGLIVVVFVLSMPRFQKIQTLVDRLNLVARENLSGMMVVRAFNRQKFEENRFDEANKDLTQVNVFVMRVMSFMMPAVMLIMNLLSVVIIWVGAANIADSTMQVGDMMAFLQYAMQIVMSFLMLSMVFIFLPRAAVSGGRIADVLETEPRIKDPASPVHLPSDAKGKIEFRDVAFRYHGGEEDALKGISFVAPAGRTTGIIGSTGSGKSTLVNLIPRLYDVVGGQVLLDGVDVRTLSQEELRANIGYVPQKNTLFTGTIRSNLAYGKPGAGDEELLAAVEIAQAKDFLAERENGLDAEMAQGGGNVSGGQKQRLSIARALAARPRVLIFDDSFSALDYKTDAALRRSLGQAIKDTTLVIVAQRVATIMNAHQILVLDDGVIVGRGTHQELMVSCPAYREIAQSQLGLEEEA